MTVHYISPLQPQVLEPWFLVEAVLLCVNLPVFLCFVIVVARAHLHINLKIVCLFFLIQYFPSIFSRFVILALQSHFLPPPRNYTIDPVVLICSFFRAYHMVLCVTLPLWLFAERRMAMVHIADYERKKRRWIPLAIISVSVSFCSLVTLSYIYDILTFAILWTPVSFLGLLGAIMFFCLVRKAKAMEKELSKVGKKSRVDYSLSLRFQLSENLWSSTLIRNAIISCGVINLTGMVSYVAARTPTAVEILGEETAQLMDCVFNICIAINGPLAAVGTLFYNEYLRNLVKTTVCSSVKVDEADAGQVHFRQLNQQWNYA